MIEQGMRRLLAVLTSLAVLAGLITPGSDASAQGDVGRVFVLPAPPARTLDPTTLVELPLPAGMSNPGDDDDSSRDPVGLPRMMDYIITSISRHRLDDTVRNEQGRVTDLPLGRVETRDYRLDRYARRGPATREAILHHYHRLLDLLGGEVRPQGRAGLRGQFLRGGLPVTVTLHVQDDGRRYELITAGPGAQDGKTATVAVGSPGLPPSVPAAQDTHPTPPATSVGRTPALVDGHPVASSQFRMPSRPTLWPLRGTRGMAVLLVGPGVHRATGVRFGTSDAEILARENARLRVRVPVLPEGGVVVTLLDANGEDRLAEMFEVMPAPRADAAVVTVPPCDSRPESPRAGVTDLQPRQVRPGEIIKIIGRRLESVTHVSFTVARHEVDPAVTGLAPELIGIDFGASGQARSAPRWLDVQAANLGRSHGVRPSVPGQCDEANRSGVAAVQHTADMEMVVCVPPLALSGPIGLWRADGASGDACETAMVPLLVRRRAN